MGWRQERLPSDGHHAPQAAMCSPHTPRGDPELSVWSDDTDRAVSMPTDLYALRPPAIHRLKERKQRNQEQWAGVQWTGIRRAGVAFMPSPG